MEDDFPVLNPTKLWLDCVLNRETATNEQNTSAIFESLKIIADVDNSAIQKCGTRLLYLPVLNYEF